MKLRTGLISPQRTDMESLKRDFTDMNVTWARNAMEFYQVAANAEYDAVVFWGDANVRDFVGSHNYLRTKLQFKKTPIALLTEAPHVFNHPFKDPALRAFTMTDGLFMSLLNFFEAVKDSHSFEDLMNEDTLTQSFQEALSTHIAGNPQFEAHKATDSELHGEFHAQLADEISTNLLWVKFSARILIEGSEKLQVSIADLGEAEGINFQEHILENSIKQFTAKIWEVLKKDGAIQFGSSLDLPAPLKLPYLKAAKSTALAFRSDTCSVLLEMIRYL